MGDGQRKRRRVIAKEGSDKGGVKAKASTRSSQRSHETSDSEDKADGLSATLMQFKVGKTVKGKHVKARVVLISVLKSRSVFEEWLKDDSQVNLVKRLRQSPSNKVEDAKFVDCKSRFLKRKASLSQLHNTLSERTFLFNYFLFYSMSLLLKFLKYIFFYYAGPSKPIPTKEDIEIGNGGDVDNGKSSQGTASRSLRDRDVKKSGQGKTSNLRMYI